MRARVFGSAIVVVVGLAPTLVGGPLFTLLMLGLGIGAFREYLVMHTASGARFDVAICSIGYLIIAALAVVGLVAPNSILFYFVVTIAIVAPLIAMLSRAADAAPVATWSLCSSGSLYVGLPIYAATLLRSLPGEVRAPWLMNLSNSFAVFGYPAPLGLAWALTTLFTIWVADSSAYLFGRSLGERKLAPSISPGKTVEGAAGGLVGGALTGAAAFSVFGLGAWWSGLLVGVIISVMGQLGDLCESLLKRQARVKDSGTAIPGHGGFLDRIDALLFAFPTSLAIVAVLGRLGG